MIAAHPQRASSEALRIFLSKLTEFVRAFDSSEKRAVDDIEFIKAKFGYPEDDIKVCASLGLFVSSVDQDRAGLVADSGLPS